jgi:hypothetical protein
MSVVDKNNLLARLPELPRVELELGCGATKRDGTAIGVDARDLPGVDLVGDVFEDLPRLVCELARVIKAGGMLTIVVPHFSNPYFYSDYTHRRFFGLYTFCYFARSSLFRREVPTYGLATSLVVVDVKLGFRSARPFYFRYAFKRGLGAVFNASRWLQECYEENFCWLFPCYEIRYTLQQEP